jgi:L-alanine-DL-glutamate epimerase-like enolase superfamily enzyme
MRRLSVRIETWRLARPFAIARGTKAEAEVVVAEIEDGGRLGRGEAVPYRRYGETAADVVEQVQRLTAAVAAGLDRRALAERLPAGAGRNALDLALWDLDAKTAGLRAWTLAGLPEPAPAVTAETIGIDSAEAMARRAADLHDRPLLKIKLDRYAVLERVAAVRRAAPGARLIVDANEAWDVPTLEAVWDGLAVLGVELIEQPLPVSADGVLAGRRGPVALFADESFHTAADLDRVAGRYGGVNVKLDKAGGLTQALAAGRAARARGLGVMVGCMVCTSLGIAPATLLTPFADVVDLDGPLWLAEDRLPALRFAEGRVHPPEPALWG